MGTGAQEGVRGSGVQNPQCSLLPCQLLPVSPTSKQCKATAQGPQGCGPPGPGFRGPVRVEEKREQIWREASPSRDSPPRRLGAQAMGMNTYADGLAEFNRMKLN